VGVEDEFLYQLGVALAELIEGLVGAPKLAVAHGDEEPLELLLLVPDAVFLDHDGPGQVLKQVGPEGVEGFRGLLSHVVVVDAVALGLDPLEVVEVLGHLADLGVHHLAQDVDVDLILGVLHRVPAEGVRVQVALVDQPLQLLLGHLVALAHLAAVVEPHVHLYLEVLGFHAHVRVQLLLDCSDLFSVFSSLLSSSFYQDQIIERRVSCSESHDVKQGGLFEAIAPVFSELLDSELFELLDEGVLLFLDLDEDLADVVADGQVVAFDPVLQLLALLVDAFEVPAFGQSPHPGAGTDKYLGVLDGQIEVEALLRRQEIVLDAFLHESLGFLLDLVEVGHFRLAVRIPSGQSDLPLYLVCKKIIPFSYLGGRAPSQPCNTEACPGFATGEDESHEAEVV